MWGTKKGSVWWQKQNFVISKITFIMSIPNILQVELKNLSTTVNCPNRANEAMIRAITSSIGKMKSWNKCKILTELKKNKIGTNDVEHGIKRMCGKMSQYGQMEVKLRIMRSKIGDAYKIYRQQRKRDGRTWKKTKKLLTGEVRQKYIEIWKRCTRGYGEKLAKNRESKLSWLKKKWKNATEGEKMGINDTVKDVVIKDEVLTEEFTSEPRKYGNVAIENKQWTVLTLPPKFGLYKKVKVRDIIISLEEALNKLRWNRVFDKKIPEITETNFIQGRKVDINNLKRTELPFNHMVCMPDALSQEEEVRIQCFKNEVVKIAKEVSKESRKWSNVGEEVQQGLDELVEKVREGEVICYETDKSGRWAVDTVENYTEGCRKLLEVEGASRKITEQEHREAEREMNSHGLALTRMMGLRNDGPGTKLRWVMKAEGTGAASMYGLRKDHKEPTGDIEQDKVTGPEMRPVCGAEDCLTSRTSYILSRILAGLGQKETTIQSTEELLKVFENVNIGDVGGRWAVGSLDVRSLYPSLDIPVCARIVGEELYKSRLDFVGLDGREIALYIRYHMTDDELRSRGVLKLCPTRKHGGRPPLFVNSGSESKKKKRHGPWTFPRKTPGKLSTRKMFSVAIEIMVARTIALHDYQFKEEIFRQTKGGAIGLDLTGEVAEVYMGWWDRQMLERMANNGLMSIVYKRFRDDINFIVDNQDEENKKLPAEEAEEETVVKIREIADGIATFIQMKEDASHRHQDKKLPLLDVKVWIGKDKIGRYKILHEHYMKEVASRALIWSTSAHGQTMKENVMVNEVLRVLRNCSEHLEWEMVAKHLTYFMRRMQFSGYDQKTRHKVLTRALEKHTVRQESKVKSGRERGIGRAVIRTKRGSSKKHEWYRQKGKYDTFMMIDPTPGGELKKQIQRAARKNKVKVKVIERVGTTVKRLLQRSRPFRRNKCTRTDCIPCKTDSEIDCRTRGCAYSIVCEECERIYRGQTGRSIYERCKEHEDDYKNQMDKCPIWRHSILCHDKQRFSYKIRIEGKCFGKPSRRLITESVLIDELSAEQTMNSKKEWTYHKLQKVQIMR